MPMSGRLESSQGRLSTRLWLPLSAIMMLSLASCATTDCTNDPGNDSYFCAEQNLRSGLYQNQLDTLQRIRQGLEIQKRDLERENRNLNLDLASAREDTAALRTQLDRLDQRLIVLHQKLINLAETENASASALESLNMRLANLVQVRNSISPNDLYSEDERQMLTRLEEQIAIMESEQAMS